MSPAMLDGRRRMLAVTLAAALLGSGCAGGLAQWEPVPGATAFLPDATRPVLESATETRQEQEPRGLGIIGGFTYPASISAFSSSAFTPVAAATTYEYADLFDNGFAFSASFILRRPATGTVAAGDTYWLGGFGYYSFSGKTIVGGPLNGNTTDGLNILGFWLDGKTIIEPLGAKGAWKAYTVYGFGFARMGEVGLDLGGIFYRPSFVPAFRGKFGYEYRTGGVGVFVETGAEVFAPPSVEPNPNFAKGDPVFLVPLTFGAVLSF